MINVIRTIQGTQSRIEVRIDAQGIVARKVATRAGSREVRQQVEFLQSLPASLAEHYPNLLGYDLDAEPGWYEMSYYAYPTARWIQLWSSLPLPTLLPPLGEVISFVFEQHHAWAQEDPDDGYIGRTYIQRPLARLKAMSEREPLFREINVAHEIVVGGEALGNPLSALMEIAESPTVMDALRPRKVCTIQGQLEFEHILLNLGHDGGSSFILIDPRGGRELLDPAYDAGKLLQSVRGKIDWLEDDLFHLGEIHNRNGICDIHHLSLELPDRVRACDELCGNVEILIADAIAGQTQGDCRMLMDLAEAAHLLSAVPFCYREKDRDRAVACFIVGCRALDRFRSRWL